MAPLNLSQVQEENRTASIFPGNKLTRQRNANMKLFKSLKKTYHPRKVGGSAIKHRNTQSQFRDDTLNYFHRSCFQINDDEKLENTCISYNQDFKIDVSKRSFNMTSEPRASVKSKNNKKLFENKFNNNLTHQSSEKKKHLDLSCIEQHPKNFGTPNKNIIGKEYLCCDAQVSIIGPSHRRRNILSKTQAKFNTDQGL
ncbi:unnamed protein product [Moneuplotes crassus]|uniref:Uncharacterized protein n=1 Tax=Euplotes crassus TaxID=5936 RepID=A0AAD1UET9_EUPCR|nr:unnamed protein product [Moneuplotes crassus]